MALFPKVAHICYLSSMFGKNRDRYVRIGGIILGVVVILSMVFYSFALTF